MTRDTEKCPLSVLTGVSIKQVNFRENISAFCRDKRNCPYKAGVLIKRVSIERGSTVFCSCVKETVLFSFLRSLCENGRSLRFPRIFIKKNKLDDRMIKQLLNSVIAKYRDLSVSRRSIICLSLRIRQIIDLLASDKSRYFAQPCPIIVNYRSINVSAYSVTGNFTSNL